MDDRALLDEVVVLAEGVRLERRADPSGPASGRLVGRDRTADVSGDFADLIAALTGDPVQLVLERLAQGARPEDLVRSHPPLTLEQVRASLAYALSTVRQDELLTGAP